MRTSTLKLGKIFNILLKDTIRIFPIIAEQGTDTPFAVYRRLSLNGISTKDIYNYEETADYEIVIATQKYDEGIALAQKVKDILEDRRYEYQDISVIDIEVIGANEDFVNEMYLQRMTVRVSVRYVK